MFIIGCSNTAENTNSETEVKDEQAALNNYENMLIEMRNSIYEMNEQILIIGFNKHQFDTLFQLRLIEKRCDSAVVKISKHKVISKISNCLDTLTEFIQNNPYVSSFKKKIRRTSLANKDIGLKIADFKLRTRFFFTNLYVHLNRRIIFGNKLICIPDSLRR